MEKYHRLRGLNKQAFVVEFWLLACLRSRHGQGCLLVSHLSPPLWWLSSSVHLLCVFVSLVRSLTRWENEPDKWRDWILITTLKLCILLQMHFGILLLLTYEWLSGEGIFPIKKVYHIGFIIFQFASRINIFTIASLHIFCDVYIKCFRMNMSEVQSKINDCFWD